MEEKLYKAIKNAKSDDKNKHDIGVTFLYRYTDTLYSTMANMVNKKGVSLLNKSDLEDIQSNTFAKLILNRKSAFYRKFDEDREDANFFSWYASYFRGEMDKYTRELYGFSRSGKSEALLNKVKGISEEYDIPMTENNAWLFAEIINGRDTQIKNKTTSTATVISAMRNDGDSNLVKWKELYI